LIVEKKPAMVSPMSLEALVPLVVVLMMIIVGTEISLAQLVASLRRPTALLGETLAQWLLLPLLAALAIWLLQPPPALAGGLLLVASSPGGALSNTYCSVGRLDVAFSVALTAVSGFVALAAMPLLLAAIGPAALGVEAVGVPVAELSLRLLLFLLLPVGVGMALRRFFQAALQRNFRAIRTAGLSLLALFLALVFLDQRHAVLDLFWEAARLTTTFTALALIAGWLSGSALRLNHTDRAVLAVEFAVRNVGIAAVLALTTFHQQEFAAFGALFVLLQAPLLLPVLLARQRLMA
jgi:BASS family bile acid:Na+ symporter